MTHADPEDANASDPQPPSLLDLFLGFSSVAVVGFGGVMPWMRRLLVEQRRWMTHDEFVEALSLAQFLPGGNVLNLSVAVGRRFHGPVGSVVSALGLLVAPFITVILLGILFLHFGQSTWVHDALAGVAAGAAGLILSMAAKLAEPLLRKRDAIPLVIVALVFAGVGLAGLPLLLVVAVMAPVSIALAWRRLQ